MAIEHKEAISQIENPAEKAREQLGALLKMIEGSTTFGEYHTAKIHDIYGKFESLSPSEKTNIGSKVAE